MERGKIKEIYEKEYKSFEEPIQNDLNEIERLQMEIKERKLRIAELQDEISELTLRKIGVRGLYMAIETGGADNE